MDTSKRNITPGQGKGQEPHPKDGHIRIPNEIVDRLAQLRASGAEWQIIFATWRRTLGWQHSGEWRNKPYPISIGDLSRATGIARRHVARAVKDLVQRNILKRIPGKQKHLLSFNLDYSTWLVSKQSLGGSGETVTNASDQIDTSLVSKRSLPPDTKSKLLKKHKRNYKETTSTKVEGDKSPDSLADQTPASKYLFQKAGRKRWKNLVQKEEFEKVEAQVGEARMKEAIDWALLSGISNIKSILTAAKKGGRHDDAGKRPKLGRGAPAHRQDPHAAAKRAGWTVGGEDEEGDSARNHD